MAYTETTATRKITTLNSRIRAIAGGTAASKTISILLYLIAMAQTDRKPTLTSIVSESFPHLKRGSMRDFLDIMQAHNYYKDDNWNRSDYTYTFETGSKIEFFSADQPGKVRGPRRDRLFINECNNVPQETFEQLEVRTREFVFLDWNPTNSFWFYEDVINRDDVQHITLTYKDNEALGESIIKSIEQRKGNSAWWRVYGEGLLGELEGQIYRNWKIIDEIPHEARLERRWLDFGYRTDPTAIGDIYYYNGGYILDEQVYQNGLVNKDIAGAILSLPEPQTLVVADSAEPKSIEEIKREGVNIIGADKGPDSVRNGINYVEALKISVTKRSLNIIKEQRNYLWAKDRLGKTISPNTPEKGFDHHMDGIRYALNSMKTEANPIERLKQARRLEHQRRVLKETAEADYGL